VTYTATYSPEDNKLRLYASGRLDAETYARVKAAGFSWAPKQELFVAPAWTPARADLLEELAGEIGDEDTGLVERAEERSERFGDYAEARSVDAERARAAVSAIAAVIPLGQPILVGHHSERHARKDAERIENGMRRAVKMWETSKYWADRAAGAIRHAKYKERPDVRARRIKGLEADERKHAKERDGAAFRLRLWEKVHEPGSMRRKDGQPSTFRERALYLANAGGYDVWSDLTADKITPEEAQVRAVAGCRVGIAWAERWLAHLAGRLAYERAMLADAGGTVAERTAPEKGGGCRCWCSPGHGGGWSFIQKVNKVSVSVLDNWGNGGPCFSRTVPFTDLKAVMSAADVAAARAAGRLSVTPDGSGYYLAALAPQEDR